MTKPAPGRRSESSREAILDATLQLCREVGYQKLRIEAIARRAGAGKQTIYRWWPTIGDLVQEALLSAADASAVFPDTGDLETDLCAQMTSVADFMTRPDLGPAYWAVLAAAHDEPRFGHQFRSTVIAGRRHDCTARLQQAVADDQLPADTDLDLLIDQLYGALYYRFIVTLEPVDETFVQRHIGAVLRHIRV